MATYTPRARVSLRPSLGGAGGNSPNLLERANTNMHRNASYNALTGQPPATPASKLDDSGFAVGDVVNVPGDMFGTIRFIGAVYGKAGKFLGVELAGEFAPRGKNSGDVEGVSYFETTVPGSGIFLPLHRAQKRFSPSAGPNGTPEELPDTPTAGTIRSKRPSGSGASPSLPKFAQTIGPGARPPSPQMKPRPRQSLPRPESPLRRAPVLQPTPSRQFSQSVRPGMRPPTTPSAPKNATPRFSASVRGGAPPARPYSRTGSRLGNRSESISHAPDLSSRTTGTAAALRSPSRLGRVGDDSADLQLQLSQKDRQLQEQAAQLLEMEAALKEVQSLMPDASPTTSRSRSGDMSGLTDTASLQRALREKNDKISSLVAEFDAHRADFRSTIETLESASEETVRMYEARLTELTGEVEALREESGNNGTSQADVEAIANQLKMLEELVAELEEGLEDARRGEAEARGEVEFLRGEVERGRSELRREREKATAGAGDANGSTGKANDDGEVESLRTRVAQLTKRNAELEAGRSALAPAMLRPNGAQQRNGLANAGAEKGHRCEGCDKPGHDLLHCPIFAQAHRVNDDGGSDLESPVAGPHPSPRLDRDFQKLAPPTSAPATTSTEAVQKKQQQQDADKDKWCALCEQDGHLAFDCPNEQY